MNKFWKWMTDNNYGRDLGDRQVIFFSGKKYGKIPTKHMLIGFMQDYLSGKSIYQNYEFFYSPGLVSYIDACYAALENKIKELEDAT